MVVYPSPEVSPVFGKNRGDDRNNNHNIDWLSKIVVYPTPLHVLTVYNIVQI